MISSTESSTTPSAPKVVERKDSLFDASHLATDLNRRIARNGAVTITTQAAKFAMRIGSVAILARLLKPADFGLIGLVTVITGFIEMFKDAGLSMATIQRKEITHAQISTLFWINVGLGAALMAIEAALAPFIAWFYHDPRLLNVALALAGLTIFGGISVQHQALLRRNMQFGRLAFIDLFSSLLGVLTGVCMAWRGFGYWSLVGVSAITTVSNAVLSFAMSRWIPSWPSKRNGVRSMLRFGSHLAGANFFNYLTRNADNFIVGKMHGEAALGVYSRAYSVFLMPMQQFLTPVSAVVIPALARVTEDRARFRSIFLEKSYMIVFCVVIATGASFAAAPELVNILLGKGWNEAVSVIRCFGVGGAIYGTNVIGGWASATHGRGDRQLKLAMIAGPIYTLSFFIGSFYGIAGVATAFSVTCAALRYPAFRYLCQDTPIRPWELMAPLLKVGAVAAVAAALSMIATSYLSTMSPFILLGAKGVVFVLTLAGFWAAGFLTLPKISRVG